MNLASDMYKNMSHRRFDFLDPDWLAGAVTGLSVIGRRSPSWQWDPFLEDIEAMCDMLGDVYPISIEHMDGVQSIYDALGGYISVIGTLESEGLWFRASPDAQSLIKQWFPGIMIVCSNNDLIVPFVSLKSFTNLIPIRGPIEDDLIQEGYI